MSFLFSAGFNVFKASICCLLKSWNVFLYFSNVLPKEEYVNIVCSIVLLWSDGNIYIFYIVSKIFFLKHEDLSDARVVSITKKEYCFVVHFSRKFIKSWMSISDDAIYWSSRLLGIFITK